MLWTVKCLLFYLSRSGNGGVCVKGKCSCKEGYSGDDCWIGGGMGFEGSLGGEGAEDVEI